ncbi:MAG: hypothetical protein ACI9QD_001265, partial [Thermoproteota archaeon]
MKKGGIKLMTYVCVGLMSFNVFAGVIGILPEKDVIIRTRLDHNWSESFLKRIETFYKNNGLGSITSNKYKGEHFLINDKIKNIVDKNVKKIVDEIGKFTYFSTENVKFKLSVENVRYKLKNLSLDLKGGNPFNANFLLSGFCLSFDKLNIAISRPSYQGADTPLMTGALKDIDILIGDITKKECLSDDHLTSTNDENKEISLSADITPSIDGKRVKLKVDNINDDKLSDFIDSSPNKIKILGIKKESIEVDDIIIESGNSELFKIKGSDLADIIIKNKSELKNILLGQLNILVERGEFKKLAKDVSQVNFRSEFWIPGDGIESYFRAKTFSKTSFENYTDISLEGLICTTEEFKAKRKKCQPNEFSFYKPSISKILSPESVKNELDAITERLKPKMIASMSEAYLNRLVDATYRAGFWHAELKANGIELGPQGAFVILDKKGNTGKFYVQVKYVPKKLHQTIIGSRQIDILVPIVCDISMRIVIRKGIPVLVFRIESLDDSKNMLYYGDSNMKSTFGKVKRFKK